MELSVQMPYSKAKLFYSLKTDNSDYNFTLPETIAYLDSEALTLRFWTIYLEKVRIANFLLPTHHPRLNIKLLSKILYVNRFMLQSLAALTYNKPY